MTEESDGLRPFCNYCGKQLSIDRTAYYHVVKHHGAEIHLGPGDYSPGRVRMALKLQIAGYVLILASIALYLTVLNPEPSGVQGIALVILMAVGFLFVAIYSEVYSYKGLKRAEEVVMDLDMVCDVCGQTMALRDFYSHTETYHPDKHTFTRRVYYPLAAFAVSALVLGFAGLFVVMVLSEGGNMSDDTAMILVVVFGLMVISGLAIPALVDRRLGEPRLKKLAKEWSERHPHSRKE